MKRTMSRRKMAAAAGLAALCVMMTPITSFAWGFGGSKQTETAKTEESYVFKSGETEVTLGAEAAPIIKALGKTTKPVFEQDSCAYQGKDKVYTYDGFEVSTYPVNGKDYIASIYFISDQAVTPEGIKIGSTAQEALKAYGDCTDEFGVYRYQKGSSELTIYTTNKVVDAVEYNVIVK